MPNVDNELALLWQRVAELEQLEISYQQRQAALEEELIELKRKGASCFGGSPSD
ncbi:MAG: hypothetical protein V7L23_16430 [Nostoc sp.]|uniref:hypothetical protein n=1 Tax=Nostoc sp. TaxID=1180 RepID=UPI002FEFD5CB